jgi:hypothetical protein
MEELTYRQEGDYLIPNLAMPEEEEPVHGKYAYLRRKYLKERRKILFVDLLTSCKLNEHLTEIEQTACERMELMTRQMAEREGVTEALKRQDQMKWVGLMNGIRARAEETILQDLIYV